MTESIIPNYSGDDAMLAPIIKALRRVVDPELSLSIVDVGLIYGISVMPDKVHVLMTMTSAACPVTDMLVDEVYDELAQLFPMEVDICVELVWAPAWTPERMSPRARALMNW
ncbi:MAG: metal-sulfur cluster assembly factor [Aquabacterium sp.]|uniref:metal-sulfur cluster assembly factor n=1 Tax=Aquabacterium sp. TaxID=1872578 RepID=UPI0025BCA64D|nr:metal-sulfur cluster assembly factor [Aquabacterium sp.]MBI5927125.1 metal-sulfur cluster assembly factor [Aquabacterium sp.]